MVADGALLWGVLFATCFTLWPVLIPRLGARQPVWNCSADPKAEPCGAAVLITGCSSGIGRHAAFTLASHGFTVFATVRKDADVDSLLAELKSDFAGISGDVIPLKLDVTDDAAVGMARAAVGRQLDKRALSLAAVVNNAGVSKQGSVEEMTPADYEFNFQVNVFGVVRITRAFLPLLKKGSRIVNIGSAAGVLSTFFMQPYGATKFAIEGLSDGWRLELAHTHGISVSLVQPGFVASGMCQHNACDARELPNVSAAILHACAAEFPRARYPVAWVKVAPTWLSLWLRHVLPDRLYDWTILMQDPPVDPKKE